MRISKVFNNNIVSARDNTGKEMIVIGNGIGFQKRKGDIVSPFRINKIYRLTDTKKEQFEQLVSSIPYEIIHVVEQIRDHAEADLKCAIGDNLLITLSDHINFAIQRSRKGIQFRNALLWEIKTYYPEEWRVSQWALKFINSELQVNLSEQEAGFIAMHLVNAELDMDTTDGMQFPKIIDDVLNIFRQASGLEIREDDISHERFVVHIKFFLQRTMKGTLCEDDAFIRSIDLSQCQGAYQCAVKIKDYVEEVFSCRVPEEEVIYLTIHLQRMMLDKNSRKGSRA